MLRRTTRLLAVLAVTVGCMVLGTSAPALAGGNGHNQGKHNRSNARSHNHHGHGNKHHRSDRRERGRHKCNRGDNNNGNCGPGEYSAWDAQWLRTSLETDLFEIASANLALQRAQNAETRTLANVLIEHHTLSLQQGTALAQQLGIEVPTEPDPVAQVLLRLLESLPAADFDVWFADLQIAGHRLNIKLATAEVEKGCNDAIQARAAGLLPILQQHLELARAAFEAAGGDQASRSEKQFRKDLRRHLRHQSD